MSDDPEDPGGAIDVTVDDEQAVTIDSGMLRETAARASRALGVPAGAALSITLVEPERMAELKEQALGVRAPTDVLSFPIDSLDDPAPGPLVLGDIVICPAVADRQARGLGHALEEEMRHLLVHGLLHILGRDHQDAAAERAMWAEERRILAAVAAGETS